jgi:phosphoesterase RecJ-like protein
MTLGRVAAKIDNLPNFFHLNVLHLQLEFKYSMSYTFQPLQDIPSFDESLAHIIELIDHAKRFGIVTHINSDGDSLGSQLGLKMLLEQLDKTVVCVNPSHVPENFTFLHGSSTIHIFDTKQPQNQDRTRLADVDVLFVLDGNSPARMRGMEEVIMQSPAKKAVIDHHQEPVKFADMYAIDTDACSTAELIYRLVTAFEQRDEKTYITKPLAEALYTGIMTDTGNFRFPRTTSDVHRIIARLVDIGVEPYQIFDNVFNQNPMNRARLLGETLSTMTTYHNGALCIMLVTQEMMRQTNTTVDHIEGFVEQTLGIQGVQMGAIVVELPDQIKMSLRSKGTIPVNKMAAHFGGGGHINAAGCRTTTMTASEARQTIIEISAPFLG